MADLALMVAFVLVGFCIGVIVTAVWIEKGEPPDA